MFQELKFIFQKNAQIERYETSDKFYACKMEENSYVSEHVLKMSGYSNRLAELGLNSRKRLSLTESFNHCRQAIKAWC